MSEDKQAERCICEDLSEGLSRIARAFGVSDSAQQHFRQSRIEMLKGIRAMVDEQIEHASRAEQHKGTRIVVE